VSEESKLILVMESLIQLLGSILPTDGVSSMIRVFIGKNGFGFIKEALEKPPEICGNMNADFIAGSYYLSDFREEYFAKSSSDVS